jgi:hypothetical protein
MVRHIVKQVHASLRYNPLGAKFAADVRHVGKNTGKVGIELKSLTGRRSRRAYGKTGRGIAKELRL